MDIFNLWILLVISHSPWTLIPASSNFFALHWLATDLDQVVTMLCYSTHFFGQVLCPLLLSLLQTAAIFILSEVVSYLCVYDSLSSDEVYLLCLSGDLLSTSAQGINYFWNSFCYTAQEGLCTLDKYSVSHYLFILWHKTYWWQETIITGVARV